MSMPVQSAVLMAFMERSGSSDVVQIVPDGGSCELNTTVNVLYSSKCTDPSSGDEHCGWVSLFNDIQSTLKPGEVNRYYGNGGWEVAV
ncbi:hypothetical protein EMMF5_002013 [Cystobasidiomycetes sp. EMM_F5]